MTTDAVSRSSAAHNDEMIPRYSFAERANHWIGALTYTYLLMTGLAFWSPYLYWLAAVVGGGPVARSWHPWVGLIFAASVFWTFEEWRRDMQMDESDRAWAKAIPYYIKNEDDKLPPGGAFQLRTEAFLLGNLLRRNPAAALWNRLVVHRSAAVEPAVCPLCGNPDPCQRSADHDWPVSDSCVHERDSRRRQPDLHASRKRHQRLGLDVPSLLV